MVWGTAKRTGSVGVSHRHRLVDQDSGAWCWNVLRQAVVGVGGAGQAWRESRTGSLQADDPVRVDSIQLLLRPHTFAETGALHDVEQMFGRVESFHEISLSSQFVT